MTEVLQWKIKFSSGNYSNGFLNKIQSKTVNQIKFYIAKCYPFKFS